MSYPNFPGSKGSDGTSQDAAVAIASTAVGLRRAALRAFASYGELTALELIDRMDAGRWSIQPCICELRKMGLIESTGERRRNPSGQSAAVQRITPFGREVLK